MRDLNKKFDNSLGYRLRDSLLFSIDNSLGHSLGYRLRDSLGSASVTTSVIASVTASMLVSTK